MHLHWWKHNEDYDELNTKLTLNGLLTILRQ
jgi:hypothetical protein